MSLGFGAASDVSSFFQNIAQAWNQLTKTAQTGTTAGTTATTGTSTSAPTYTVPQTGMQGSLADAISSILGGTGYSPQVKALQTQSADQINKSFQQQGDRTSRFLASRGFGQSGKMGTAALQTDLARQAALANNNATYGGMALSQFNQGLADALQYAFANPGYSATSGSTGTTSGTTSSTGSTDTTGTQNTTQTGGGQDVQVGGGVKI